MVTKQKKNFGALFIFLGFIAAFALLMFVIIKKKDRGSNQSVDEATIAAIGQEKVKETAAEIGRAEQAQFGAQGLKFDSAGNLMGSSVEVHNLPQNRTFEDLEKKAGEEKAVAMDTSEINAEIGQYDVTQQMYIPTASPINNYRNVSDADAAKASREVTKIDRELYRESTLAFSMKEGINGRGSGISSGIQGIQRELMEDQNDFPNNRNRNSGNNSDPVNNYLDLVKSFSQGNEVGQPSQSANSSFGALERPLISKPGQVSDMRIGGSPEIIIREGKFLDGVTINAVETSFHDNPVQVLINRDFVDVTGRFVLIPQGTKILGLAFRVSNQQQTRMFISFHRALFPDGRSAYFPERQVPEAFNPEGLLGSNAKVNNFWFRKFGAAITLGVVEGLAYSAAGGSVRTDPMGGQNMTGTQYGIQQTSRQFEEVSKRLMDYYSNFAPTVSVKPGTRIKIYFSEDVLLSAYSKKS
jgi:type IV secretory pathway VirB10-like protein